MEKRRVTYGSGAWRAPHRGVFAALMFALLAAACARFGAGGQQVLLPDPPKTAESSPASQREHQRILAAYGGPYEDAKLEAVIAQTVDRLVAASERPDLRYRITILNSSAVNAFALPSGQLYVTRGLVALANDTSELASVLAHEMSHVIARHAAIRENQARQAALVNRVVTDVLSDPQIGALALARSKIALASFSRAQEFEADGIGVGIASRAGFDPYGAVRFLTSMGRNAELKPRMASRGAVDFLSSHPATPERVRNAQGNARQYTAPGAGQRERSAYLASLEGLVYGEDPSEGFVRGRRFLHAKLGFTFMAPEGFSLENTAQAVLGIKDGGTQAFRLDVVKVPAEQTLAEYLVSGWIENVERRSIEEYPVNGFPAATATAKGDKWSFRLYVVRFGSDVYRFIFAAKQKSAETDRSFRDSVGSFRRMTLTEVQAARPLRIKVVTVEPGDTVEKLATRMDSHDRQLERFRVLNGFDAADRVKPGDLVKLIAE
ncbi:MAG: M48 family metalloprotease [Proteobacteria bacterium]|nr:M48 family metalloprotease [Pseudomonadota bacterium]